MERARPFEVVLRACDDLRGRYRKQWESERDQSKREDLWLKTQVVREVELELQRAIEPERPSQAPSQAHQAAEPLP
jgi:hypothetical protein